MNAGKELDMVGYFRKPHVHNREIGRLVNVVKVFKMQQMDGLWLEKLRGGAHKRLIRAKRRPYAAPLGGSRVAQEEEANGRSSC